MRGHISAAAGPLRGGLVPWQGVFCPWGGGRDVRLAIYCVRSCLPMANISQILSPGVMLKQTD